MYTDEDLNLAVKQQIFSSDAVEQFRRSLNEARNTQAVDEENFRLISGFNDVFVVIASALLLSSLAWLGYTFSPSVGAVAVAVGSWALAEYFVIQRRMALPAIVLLLSFLGGTFAVPILFDENVTEFSIVLAGLMTTIAAVLHWRRFKVPITMAAGAGALSACLIAVILYFLPITLVYINHLVFACGLIIFGFAMYWDSSDRVRQTRASDVAFWLHLIAAPMIVHPIFSSLGILEGEGGLAISFIVLGLYVLLALISIAVDRRAIMVSALVYVIYAFSSLMETYGMVTYSFAVTGICIGSTLLLLSAFWHDCRKRILKLIPQNLQLRLPEIQV